MGSHENRYRIYSEHLKSKFGQKVYKLPVNLPGTCPNRDGTIGTGGCIYCDEEGAGFDAQPNTVSIKQQIERNKTYFRNRFKAKKFISYFQSFTNTYLPVFQFENNVRAALGKDIVGISIATRPDCVNEEYLDVLSRIQDEYDIDINIELGLQTVNYKTLEKINRGHSLAEFIDAVNRVKIRGFEICIHLILNLPWDEIEDSVEAAKILSALEVEYVKLHSLYIVENTKLGEMYLNGEISVCSLEEYVRRSAAFIQYLDPEIVLQRLTGKGPKDKVLFCNWDLSWWEVKQAIEKYLEENDIWQGDKFDYLNRRWKFV